MSFWKQAILVAVLVFVAAGWYAYRNPEIVGLGQKSAGNTGAAQGSGSPARIPGLISGGAVNIVAVPVATDNTGDTVMALGTAEAAQSVVLYPQVSGVIAEVPMAPGRAVKAGDLLFRLQNDEENVAVEKAKIALDQAKSTLERQQTLAKSKTISSVALSDSETAVRLADVELKSAEIDLDRRDIRAPFAGVTGLTDISIGDFVTTTTALATLDDMSLMHVDFEIPERWAAAVAEGQSVAASAQGMPGSQFAGRITGIDNRIDETTRTLRLKAEVPNPDGALKPGMAVLVKLRFDTGKQLTVPSLAVQWDRRGSFVWKVVGDAVKRADVAIMKRESGIVVVNGDVAEGDKVVVEGLMRLRDGAKVKEVNETPATVDEAAPPSASALTPADTPPLRAGVPAEAGG
jgi:RND family efflux transporter MFP subunit